MEIDLQYEAGAAIDSPLPLRQAGAPQQIAVRSVEMRIRDDGAGFDTGEASAPGHYGLGMMRERAEAVRAQLDGYQPAGSRDRSKTALAGNPEKGGPMTTSSSPRIRVLVVDDHTDGAPRPGNLPEGLR